MKTSSDPLDLEYAPGATVRSLTTPAECAAAIMLLENDMSSIRGQISKAEADPDSVQPGWRSRAQSAIRWKRIIVRTIREHSASMSITDHASKEKWRRHLLSVIREEIGPGRFVELKELAAAERPDLAAKVPEIAAGDGI